MSIQQILDSGQVDNNAETSVLEAAQGMIEFQLGELKASSWGAMGMARIKQLTDLQAKIQSILNGRRGIDGMTLLSDGPSDF
ncbi:hypothetical protein G8759_19870 [Spirosoma aureum]|uniref:Uncharacterized protein n=1 Tax=Spirosoma aureum TaxID=2692134 RepID=A0A6G9AQU8_9BACT|nr:hypothetical protein [Spirosoma aureum]QIP14709.1 hypothetical protein G8759_19870 [Spirosoma aureum]